MSQELQSAAPGRTEEEPRAAALRLSVLLPVFAEKEVVAEIARGLVRGVGDDLHEIMVLVHPKAPDETMRICEGIVAELPCARLLIQERYPGLGWGIRQGIAEATGTHLLLMDSDGEMDVETVPRMVAALKREGVDMVVASRWMKGGGVVGYGRAKYFFNRGYQFLFRLLFRTQIHDLTLGFKLCRTDIMQAMPWDSEFHDIGCETTLRPIRAGATVTEVPTVWTCRKEGQSSNPFLRNFKYVWKALAILLDSRHPRVGS